jgi:hypothetical protein
LKKNDKWEKNIKLEINIKFQNIHLRKYLLEVVELKNKKKENVK